MRRIIKFPPPNNFITYCQSTNPEDPNYKPSYEGMDKDTRKELKLGLLNEQGWVCGYCMQKINQYNMTIEHHCEQTICNGENGRTDRALDYTNMLAVCKGKIGSELHCDKQKSQFDESDGLPMNLSPLIAPHMATIKYSTTGLVSSSNNNLNNEMDKFLNINTKHLRNLRSEKFRKIYATSKHPQKAKEKAKMKSILEKDLQKAGNAFSNSFPGMSEYMLSKFC